MSVEDNQITASARRVLASNWVDLSQISVRTVRGVIYLSGHLQRMTHEYAEMDERILHQLDLDLHGLSDVRDINYDLDNWECNDSGAWKRPRHYKSSEPPPLFTFPKKSETPLP